MKHIDQWLLEQSDARIYRDDERIASAARKLLKNGITDANHFEACGLGQGEDKVSEDEFAAYALPVLEDAIWLAVQEKIEHMMDDLAEVTEGKVHDLLPSLIENASTKQTEKVAA